MNDNLFTGFHEAGPNVDKTLSKWTKEYEAIGDKGGSQMPDLSSTMDKLPQMTERKKKIDMHVKIASRILSEIKSRQIDKL